MRWNSDLYDDKHDFVAEYGKDLLNYIAEDSLLKILDLGCGTGALTKELWEKTPQVVGVDASADMIRKAKEINPELTFLVMDGCELIWENEYDIVFSNAVFHWILTPEKLLLNIYKVLKPRGHLICEFGGKGNIEKIEGAFVKAMADCGHTYESPFYFPDAESYGRLLQKSGFSLDFISLNERLTSLADGDNGLENWLRQFFAGSLSSLSSKEQESIIRKTEDQLRNTLYKEGQWFADYARLRVVATKNG